MKTSLLIRIGLDLFAKQTETICTVGTSVWDVTKIKLIYPSISTGSKLCTLAVPQMTSCGLLLAQTSSQGLKSSVRRV